MAMKTSTFFRNFTGCDVGEVRTLVILGTEAHSAAEKLVRDGLLQRHPQPTRRMGYSLTAAGKVKADKRVARIG